MSPLIYLDNRIITNVESESTVSTLKRNISQEYKIPEEDLYVTINGKIAADDFSISRVDDVIRISTRLVGGKGGFGSMLRAIGAQIEKTTNREACRDLSGRRLRDINEEKRLRKWLEGTEDREKEAVERKQMKIQRLLAEPKIKVDLSPDYEKERQELPERVSAAVDAGWEAAGSSKETGTKRKADNPTSKGKKKKLWFDEELSDCSSISEDDDADEKNSSPKQVASTDSGNESDKNSSNSKTISNK